MRNKLTYLFAAFGLIVILSSSGSQDPISPATHVWEHATFTGSSESNNIFFYNKKTGEIRRANTLNRYYTVLKEKPAK